MLQSQGSLLLLVTTYVVKKKTPQLCCYHGFVRLLTSSFVPKLVFILPRQAAPFLYPDWLPACQSHGHRRAIGQSHGRAPPLPDEEEIPSTDNFTDQNKSPIAINLLKRATLEEIGVAPPPRCSGRAPTVKPCLVVIVAGSSSSGHVGSSGSAFVNIYPGGGARCACAEPARADAPRRKVPLSTEMAEYSLRRGLIALSEGNMHAHRAALGGVLEHLWWC